MDKHAIFCRLSLWIDGLEGKCFFYAELYGADRTHILSGNPLIKTQAKDIGIPLVEGKTTNEGILGIINKIKERTE